MKQLFLMKPHHLTKPAQLARGNWFLSPKLDGMRAFWDGGVSRGRADTPWAPGVISTGLWTNNANVVHAPEWFLDGLPAYPLDCELWAGVQRYQHVVSTCRRHIPDDAAWSSIRLVAHTPVTLKDFCVPRTVNEPNCKLVMPFDAYDWCLQRTPNQCDLSRSDVWYYLEQQPVTADIYFQLPEILNSFVENGHEGIVLRQEPIAWKPERVYSMLKLKPFTDAEGIVIGACAGAATDKGSKLLGLMGSLMVQWRGHTVHVAGFRDDERTLTTEHGDEEHAIAIAERYEGSRLPDHCYPKRFPRGTTITFKYRETYDSGMPKDARYWRIRKDD